MNKKYYLILFLLFIASSGYSKILVSPNYPSLDHITLTGTVDESDIGNLNTWGWRILGGVPPGSQFLFLTYRFENGSFVMSSYLNNNETPYCPEEIIEGEDFVLGGVYLTEKGRLKAINAINQQISGGLIMTSGDINNPYNPDNLVVVDGSISVSAGAEGSTVFYCVASPEHKNGYGMHMPVNKFAFLAVSPDPNFPSTCSLNSQNLELNFTSGRLDVTGLSQNTNLIITCSSGEGKNYKLSLKGNNVIDGRLNFGNGVSAQVSLDGIQVQANGSGITLNNLNSKTITVSASLVGSSSSPGITNTTGVLVLDAL